MASIMYVYFKDYKLETMALEAETISRNNCILTTQIFPMGVTNVILPHYLRNFVLNLLSQYEFL